MNTITPQQIADTAKSIGVEPAALAAVAEVESNGNGYLPSGKVKILFEGHIFWQQLVTAGINPRLYNLQNPDILFKERDITKYIGKEGEYRRLEKAKAIHAEAALKSASWGAFQIMGFNHKECGYATVTEFVTAMQEGATNQLQAVAKFIQANNLDEYLHFKDWAAFARKYNGPGYAQNKYDTKLAAAYAKNIHLNSL